MSNLRIGHGYDVHRLVEGRKLIIGGVELQHHLGLLGHSDADVLVHAIMDAIIGAMGLGDIGKHFPDTDDTFHDISSLVLLEKTVDLMKKEGYDIVNIDSTIIAQKPKMLAHIPTMKENVAKILDCSPECINIKATTEERLGFTGREEGIAAHAVVLIEKK
ncbi:MAG: 2-C-methyl-D-erythritol 2,4-cyclodiphosphate synthase [Clostridia bacterium]|nr:2-C-methyl-D-erythritol 2,4-cyclodiphosphate synthase [Clostridia bacterium]